MEKIMTVQVTSLSYDDLVNLFNTACYGNGAVKISVPHFYRALMDGADCIEGLWANVLLSGGHIEVYDMHDQSNTREESELNRYGLQGTNWVSTSFRTYGHTDISVTAYRISLETLLKGMSNNKALPYIEKLLEKEEGDMFTAWNLLQIAIFGEIIYG